MWRVKPVVKCQKHQKPRQCHTITTASGARPWLKTDKKTYVAEYTPDSIRLDLVLAQSQHRE